MHTQKRNKMLDFPTEESPISKSLKGACSLLSSCEIHKKLKHVVIYCSGVWNKSQKNTKVHQYLTYVICGPWGMQKNTQNQRQTPIPRCTQLATHRTWVHRAETLKKRYSGQKKIWAEKLHPIFASAKITLTEISHAKIGLRVNNIARNGKRSTSWYVHMITNAFTTPQCALIYCFEK